MGDDLEATNLWLAEYDVTMYRGEDGRCRIWGDVNRIQDLVDDPRSATWPTGARTDLDAFFSTEVDGMVAQVLRDRGYRTVEDDRLGIEIVGESPGGDEMEACSRQAYAWFAVPPEDRPPGTTKPPPA